MKSVKKQISLVLEVSEDFNELVLMERVKYFLLDFPEVKIVGTHIKLMDKYKNEKKY